MSVTIIGDIGSCHMGNIDYCKEAIDIGEDIGLDVVKFQLFPNESPYTKRSKDGVEMEKPTGNVHMPYKWWTELWEYAENKVEITASVFDAEAIDTIQDFNVPFIKFGYSQNHRKQWMAKLAKDHQIMVSCDDNSINDINADYIRLFCISQYPVNYLIDFEGLFVKGRFDGFSDHTRGSDQTLKAVRFGAMYIEKHMKLDHEDVICPDANFALLPEQMEKLIRKIR